MAVWIFGTYDDVLDSSGPVGIWLWIIVWVGRILVALVIAQFAARISLSGSSYRWASRLANPKIGWGFGWLTFCYLVLGVVAVDFALASQAFMPLAGIEPDERTARLITLLVLLIQAVLAIASTRIVSLLNGAAVGVDLALVVLTVALIVAVLVTPPISLPSAGFDARDDHGTGNPRRFDAAAYLAEEAKDPFRSVPRAIVGSVVAAAVLGLVFLIALTVTIRDIPAITADGSPVAAIMGVMLMVAMPGAALLELITAGTILPAITYGSTIVLYLAVRKRLDRRTGAFSLGRFDLPGPSAR